MVATAPAAGRAAPTADRHGLPRRPGLRVVGPHRRRRAARPARRLVVLAIAVTVAAPMAVAGAYADITGGQVHLTRLQLQLNADQQLQSRLERQVARLEDPATIVGEAKAQGMVPAPSVQDIPEVPLGAPAGAATSAPSAASATPGAPRASAAHPGATSGVSRTSGAHTGTTSGGSSHSAVPGSRASAPGGSGPGNG